MNFTQQPLQLAVAVVLIIAVIGLIQLNNQKQLGSPTNNANLVQDISNATPNETTSNNSNQYPSAPEVIGIQQWLNSQPLTLQSLRGKVVLIDFWTYSCINCIRTLPYMNAWHEKYAMNGLVIIGVHSPEFDFEKETKNVQNAINQYNIKYPVAMDNDFLTWRNYSNHYWPAKYLIDANGLVRYFHFGEGSYAETEQQIQQLLQEAKLLNEKKDMANPTNTTAVNYNEIGTPELYFGHDFKRQLFGNEQGATLNQTATYTIPADINPNFIYLQGDWNANTDHQTLVSKTGEIQLLFKAKSVNIVLGSPQPVELEVFIDDEKVNTLTVQNQQLYNLITLPEYGTHRLKVKINSSGLEAYAFTFG